VGTSVLEEGTWYGHSFGICMLSHEVMLDEGWLLFEEARRAAADRAW